jgi:hypothetical protein
MTLRIYALPWLIKHADIYLHTKLFADHNNDGLYMFIRGILVLSWVNISLLHKVHRLPMQVLSLFKMTPRKQSFVYAASPGGLPQNAKPLGHNQAFKGFKWLSALPHHDQPAFPPGCTWPLWG